MWLKIKDIFGLFVFLLYCRTDAKESSEGIEPNFAELIPNITIAAGRSATLPCVVEHIQNYKVAWVHTNLHALLTVHDRVITRNHRYSISHNGHTWWLHITDVQEADGGEYMCQINTAPMKSQVGYLEVVVPPKIDEEFTSSDTEIREGGDITLQCRATGSPPPKIKWRREDQKDIPAGFGTTHTTGVEGEYLNISKASRLHMGAYLCIASNGVQPSVSKRIMLSVHFAPMIWIPNQLVGAPIETDVFLDCGLESNPTSVTYWTRDNGIMILSNTKYDALLVDSGLYKAQMRLQIRDLNIKDYGSYTCVAKNSLGETEGTIKLYEIPRPTTFSSTVPHYFTKNIKTEGTQHTTSERVIISTWQNSLFKDEYDAKKAELSTELHEKDTTLGVAFSARNKPREQGIVEQTKSEQARKNNANHTSFSCHLLFVIVFLLHAKLN